MSTKTQPAPARKKLPRAKACHCYQTPRGYLHAAQNRDYLSAEDHETVHPCAVLPFRTATAAREFAKVANMTDAQRTDLIAKLICNDDGLWTMATNYQRGGFRATARAVLRALHFNEGEK